MQQKFTFKRGVNYAGRAIIKHNTETDEWWCSSVMVNLAAMDDQKNSNYKTTPIKDDDDAIERVIYNLNHEFLHVAQHNSGHHNSIEQERHIYNMIGNGGSEYFNTFYKIERNPVIEKLTS